MDPATNWSIFGNAVCTGLTEGSLVRALVGLRPASVLSGFDAARAGASNAATPSTERMKRAVFFMAAVYTANGKEREVP